MTRRSNGRPLRSAHEGPRQYNVLRHSGRNGDPQRALFKRPQTLARASAKYERIREALRQGLVVLVRELPGGDPVWITRTSAARLRARW